MKAQKQYSGIYPKPSEIHNSSDTMLLSIYTFSTMYGAMTQWLPDYQLRACDSKPLGDSKSNSTFHVSEVNKASSRNS